MIDLMKKTYAPKEQTESFVLLPKGDYVATVRSMGEWNPKQNPVLEVYVFDDEGHKVKDENGKELKERALNVTTYSSQVIFQISEGEFAGKDVYYWLNLHPNQPWAFPAFIHACGVTDEIHPSEAQSLCTGAVVTISVDVETKKYPSTDKVTGLTTEKERTQNVVKRVKQFVPEV